MSNCLVPGIGFSRDLCAMSYRSRYYDGVSWSMSCRGQCRVDVAVVSCVVVDLAGTGVAPLRSLLQHRQYLLSTLPADDERRKLGPITLYFGCRCGECVELGGCMRVGEWCCCGDACAWRSGTCRRHDSDFLYEEEWHSMLGSGALAELQTAFSRDQVCAVVTAGYIPG